MQSCPRMIPPPLSAKRRSAPTQSTGGMPRSKSPASFRVMFERAVVVCDTRRTPSFVVYPDKGKPFAPKLRCADGYCNELKAFLEWTGGKSAKSPFEAKEARDSVAIVDAEKKSAKTGKVVKL